MPSRWLRVVAPLISLLLIVAGWQAAVVFWSVPSTLIPRPAQTALSLWQSIVSGEMLPHILATVGGAAIGYAVGSVAALLLASVMAVSVMMERLLTVHLQAFQAIPKVALAPLVFLWFGFGQASTVALVAMSCFYPVFVNTFAGLRAANADLIALYRVFGAGRLRIFVSVQLPCAAGQVFVGLQVGVVFALISAVVMEFVSGSQGLGYTIQAASTTLDTASVFASLLLLAAIGVSSAALVRYARKRVVFWERGSAYEENLH